MGAMDNATQCLRRAVYWTTGARSGPDRAARTIREPPFGESTLDKERYTNANTLVTSRIRRSSHHRLLRREMVIFTHQPIHATRFRTGTDHVRYHRPDMTIAPSTGKCSKMGI